MPREIKNVEWPDQPRRDSVDWDRMSDGKPRAFKPGTEFGEYETFKACAYQAAARRGMKARVKRNERGEAIVQFFPQTESSGG